MAITSVTFKPKVWSSAYNPIVWSVYSNKVTETDMKYVFDVYVNSATGATASYTYRIKQRPNPSGYGMIDVSSLVQPYVELTNWSAEKGWTLPYRNASEIMPSVHVKVGEEYLVNGALTIFNGSGATASPAYFLSPYGATGSYVRVIPSSLDFNTQNTIMADYTSYNPFWEDYIMDGNGKFLSEEPGDRTIRFGDRHTLTFLNRFENGGYGSYAASILGIKIDTYGATGALGSSFYYNTTTNGGGPQTLNTYTSTTETRETDMLTFRCGPLDLSLSSSLITYYTATAYLKLSATSSSTPVYVASETIRFDISTECEDLYENVRLSWLNSLGGRDYYNFTMFYEKTTDSKSDTYNQFPLNFSGTVPTIDSTNANSTANWLRGGDKIFNKTVSTSFQIQTDWLTQDYVDYLAGVAESSSVWAYIGDSDIPQTIVIDNVKYTYKNVKQTKLVQATYDCKYTKTQVKQNL